MEGKQMEIISTNISMEAKIIWPFAQKNNKREVLQIQAVTWRNSSEMSYV